MKSFVPRCRGPHSPHVHPRLGNAAAGLLTAGLCFFCPAVPAVNAQGFFLLRQSQKPVAEMVTPKQEPATTVPRVLDRANPDTSQVLVSISKQRVYLMVGDEIAIDSPISSGRRGHPTPTGSFEILEKDPDHRSSIYGNYVDSRHRVVRSGISALADPAPAGTHYEGAPMKYFMRLTDQGVGMHIGILPGYPASHGCIRLPADIAPIIYSKVRVGTKVRVEP